MKSNLANTDHNCTTPFVKAILKGLEDVKHDRVLSDEELDKALSDTQTHLQNDSSR